MSIKFIKEKIKIKDVEELEKIAQDLKSNPARYSREARILKQFMLALLKKYPAKGVEIPSFEKPEFKNVSFKEFESMRKRDFRMQNIKVPEHLAFKLNAPSYIKFNLPKLEKLIPKAPNKVEIDDAPEKIEL